MAVAILSSLYIYPVSGTTYQKKSTSKSYTVEKFINVTEIKDDIIPALASWLDKGLSSINVINNKSLNESLQIKETTEQQKFRLGLRSILYSRINNLIDLAKNSKVTEEIINLKSQLDRLNTNDDIGPELFIYDRINGQMIKILYILKKDNNPTNNHLVICDSNEIGDPGYSTVGEIVNKILAVSSLIIEELQIPKITSAQFKQSSIKIFSLDEMNPQLYIKILDDCFKNIYPFLTKLYFPTHWLPKAFFYFYNQIISKSILSETIMHIHRLIEIFSELRYYICVNIPYITPQLPTQENLRDFEEFICCIRNIIYIKNPAIAKILQTRLGISTETLLGEPLDVLKKLGELSPDRLVLPPYLR